MGVALRTSGHDAGSAPRYVSLMTTKPTTTRPAQQGQIGQAFETLSVETRGPGLSEQTAAVRAWLDKIGAADGLLTLFIRHTSASLLIQENADPEVRRDLERFLVRLVPDGDRIFRHDAEGPDDMPAHVRSVLTATTLSIPVANGRPMLGTWQGIWLYEHRTAPHRRTIHAHLLGA